MLTLNADLSPVRRLGDLVAAAGKGAAGAAKTAVRRARDQAWTQMVRAEVAQTGLKRQVIARALHKRGGDAIVSRGGNVRLKYFGARETRAGVSAAPWGRRSVFPGTFIKGGRFPRRVALNMGGHAFRRAGKPRLPIEGGRSGLYIPLEMVTGQTAVAFYATVERVLPGRLEHELRRLLG